MLIIWKKNRKNEQFMIIENDNNDGKEGNYIYVKN
jgi:hypothetical protein